MPSSGPRSPAPCAEGLHSVIVLREESEGIADEGNDVHLLPGMDLDAKADNCVNDFANMNESEERMESLEVIRGQHADQMSICSLD